MIENHKLTMNPSSAVAAPIHSTVSLEITQPVTLERTPAQVVAPAPNWGEHTDEVLAEAGYSDDDISRFHAQGVV
jgi:crotonobetainyl-CoA:carnitine CoA-transferase CaiB-like acyl-CoA transferase